MERRPAKAAPEKEPVAAHRNARGAQPILRQAAQTPAVAQHPQGLSSTHERKEREQACGPLARRRRHHERGRRHCRGKRRAGSDERAPELDRGPQQRLQGIAGAHGRRAEGRSSPRAGRLTARCGCA